MNTCPHCHKAIEEKSEPKGYPLVGLSDGKEQRVENAIYLAPKHIVMRRKDGPEHAEEIPVICIMERS